MWISWGDERWADGGPLGEADNGTPEDGGNNVALQPTLHKEAITRLHSVGTNTRVPRLAAINERAQSNA